MTTPTVTVSQGKKGADRSRQFSLWVWRLPTATLVRGRARVSLFAHRQRTVFSASSRCSQEAARFPRLSRRSSLVVRPPRFELGQTTVSLRSTAATVVFKSAQV